MYRLIRELAALLQPYNALAGEREKTRAVAAARLGSPQERRCAVCGVRPGRPRPLAVAHIFGIGEGGYSEGENLISLCHGGHPIRAIREALILLRSLGSDPSAKTISIEKAYAARGGTFDGIGCHMLFDWGFFSRDELRKIGDSPGTWGQNIRLRNTALNTPALWFEADFNPAIGRIELLRLAKQRVNAHGSRDETNAEQWLDDVCKLLSIARRFGGHRQDATLRRYGAELQSFLDSSSSRGSRGLDRAYYELALVSMSRLPTPDVQASIRLLDRSFTLAEHGKSGYAKSRAEWAHARMLIADRLAPAEYQEIRNVQTECGKILGTAGPDSADGRWLINLSIHEAQTHIKFGDHIAGEQSALKAHRLRNGFDVTSGWRQIQGIHLNLIDGAILARRGLYEEALHKLARAVIPMQASLGKRPEGYRDAAQCAAWVLSMMKSPREAATAARIGNLMVDGRSGFWRAL